MATNLSSWTKEVAPVAPTAPDFLIERMVLRACREFCERTHLWRSTLTRVSTVADTQTYTLTAPSGGEIIKIQSVKYKADGEADAQFANLNPASDVEEDRHNDGAWEFQTAPDPTAFYFNHLTDTLYLYPIPEDASTSGLLIKVIAKPDLSATTVQDFLWEKFQEVIMYGARALLLEETGQPWSDPASGGAYRRKFNSGIYKAMNQKYAGFVDKKLRVKQRKFV